MQTYDLLYKVCMLGDSGVGKSCIVKRFVDGTYTGGGGSTIGAEFGTKTIEDDGKVVKVHVWDTAGQERFRSLTANTIRGSHGAMFVYDITDRESFMAIRDVWVQELEAKSGSRQPVVRLLVGNKSDMEDKRAVSYQEAEEWANEVGMPFIETSAKDSTNVDNAYRVMISTIRSAAPERLAGEDKTDVVPLPQPAPKKPLCRCG